MWNDADNLKLKILMILMATKVWLVYDKRDVISTSENQLGFNDVPYVCKINA